jgi:DNA-binding HxlR family transcriptional regulator
MPTSPPSVEYQMTELGSELIPAITAIVDVSHRLRQKMIGACSAGDAIAA